MAYEGLQMSDPAEKKADTGSQERLASEMQSAGVARVPAIHREVMVYANCPRCGANGDAEAKKKCQPDQDGDCPMCCEPVWKDALASVNEDFIMSQDATYWQQAAEIEDLKHQLVEQLQSANVKRVLKPGSFKDNAFIDGSKAKVLDWGKVPGPESVLDVDAQVVRDLAQEFVRTKARHLADALEPNYSGENLVALLESFYESLTSDSRRS